MFTIELVIYYFIIYYNYLKLLTDVEAYFQKDYFLSLIFILFSGHSHVSFKDKYLSFSYGLYKFDSI